MMNYTVIERDILSANRVKNTGVIDQHRTSISTRIKQIDYNMERLLENHTVELTSKLRPFYDKQCAEYSALNRLLRIINAVSGNKNV